MAQKRVIASLAAGLGSLALLATGGTASAAAGGALPSGPGSSVVVPDLPLGPAGTSQSVTSSEVMPGVTFSKVSRGAIDSATRWVVEFSIPAGATSPDPDAPPSSVQVGDAAKALVDRLAAAGFTAQVQPVMQVGAVDVPDGVIGDRVRLIQTFATKAEADAEVTFVKAAGFNARSWYQGWDGQTNHAGHWNIDIVTIDPRTFKGELGLSYGPDLERRETPTWLAGYLKAKVVANAGFFVFDPAAGAPGDPAGVGVYNGKFESEPIAQRPALVLPSNSQGTRLVRPTWTGSIQLGTQSVDVDGVNRVPGLIRNCGGDAGDLPTALPVHDSTCTDSNELVAFTPAFGPTTPVGAGSEVVLDQAGRVVKILGSRGVALAAGQRSIQGIGTFASTLSSVAVGQNLGLKFRLTAAGGSTLIQPNISVVNGGPQLVLNGKVAITQKQDGFVHQGDPSFQYGWVLQRNPRTFAGVDAQGRTVIVAIDGRQLNALGASIPETAAVAKALGLTDALNLDGGGSTAMAIDGALVGSPSDGSGERPVGDAIYVR